MPHHPAKSHNPAGKVTAPPSPSAEFGGLPTRSRFSRLTQTISRLANSERVRDLISFQVSLVFHCLLMVLLAMVMVERDESALERTLVLAPEVSRDEALDVLDTSFDSQQVLDALTDPATEANEYVELATESIDFQTSDDATPGGLTSSSSEITQAVPTADLLTISEAPVGGGFEGRTRQKRAEMARRRGGSPDSENAVELGLAWLAAHQWQDGGWRLDHRKGPCDSRCRNPGEGVETSIGATGLSLLPFLGAGYTHKQGPYAEVVSRGLEFLKTETKQTNSGGDLHWDTVVGMYAQGIATLALCEAYGMTGDPELEPYAQSALTFICKAQHSRGGWRYKRREPGDTTVTGWQVMALKSGRLSQLQVPQPVLDKAGRFLNTVQDGRGAFYGYTTPTKEPGSTAVGLLLRMYLGWTRQDERLTRGVRYLARLGPSENDMYFNYYATQVLHHYDGPHWEPWNQEMRDYLVATQAKQGHEAGSWYFPDHHGTKGGRHYTTAVSTMILEVYYRHMPLYGDAAVEWETAAP